MSAGRGEASRRIVLAAVVWVVADAPVVRMSRAEAQYQETPRGGLSCAGCSFFRRPRGCQVVEGDVSPNGWCRLFDLPD
jgi:hypothetical protein